MYIRHWKVEYFLSKQMTTYTITVNEKSASGKLMLQKLKELNLNLHKVSAREIKRELTVEEEREAFLHTSKVNAAKIFSKQL